MSNDAPPLGVRRRSWPRLVALLVLVALACLATTWLARSKPVTAIALFEVRRDTPSLVGNQSGQITSGSDFEILKKTQIALLKSKFVLTSALRNQGITSLAVLAGQADPVTWLQDHLEVGYPQDGEILEIKLRGTGPQTNDLIAIVDAVAEAYKKEVLGAEKARQLAQRDMLERSLQNLNSEFKRKYEDYLDIAKGMGRADGDIDPEMQIDMKRMDRIDEELTQLEREQLRIETGGDDKDAKFVKARIPDLRKRQSELLKSIQTRSTKSVELTTRKNELDGLQSIADELSVTLEKIDIDSQSPGRIRQVQTAIIEPGRIASQ